MSEPAILVLADGSVFHGSSIGAKGHTVGAKWCLIPL